MKTKLLAVAVVVLSPFTLSAQDAAGVNAKIVEKLTELVQVRQQQLEIEQALHQSGRAAAENGAGVEVAQVELAEARVELARESGQHDALIAALQGLVAANEHRVEWARRMKDLARASDVEIKQAQAALLKAQVHLLRAQK